MSASWRSSYAAVWLSQIPCQIPDHFFIPCSTGAVRAEFDRQAPLDWEALLSLRAAELRLGADWWSLFLPFLRYSTIWRRMIFAD